MFVLNGSANKLFSYRLDLQNQDVLTNFHIQPALDVYKCILNVVTKNNCLHIFSVFKFYTFLIQLSHLQLDNERLRNTNLITVFWAL